MPFNRPPRLQKPLPTEVLKIPTPPSLPSKPENTAWITILLPLGAVLLSVVLMLSFMDSSSSALSYLFFLPIMLVSYLAAMFVTRSQKKNYEKKLVEGRNKFRTDLREIENRLILLNKAETDQRLKNDPDPGECILISQRQDARLGERRPDDADFLHIRLGVGNTTSSYTVEDNHEEKNEEFLKEYEFINQLVDQYTLIKNVPIQARIPLTGSIGLAGARNEVLGVTRALLAQLMVHHWPAEVNLAVCCSIRDQAAWSWINQLPYLAPKLPLHYRNPKGNPEEPDQRFLTALEAEIQRREQAVETQKLMKKEGEGTTGIPFPRLLVLFDYLPETYHHPSVSMVLKRGRELGIYGIFLKKLPQQIPGECGAILEVNNGRIVYSESGPEGYTRECITDTLGVPQAEMLAAALAKVEWPASKDDSHPPEVITFLDLFGYKKVEELPLEKWWDEKTPYGFLRAPIGRLSATSDMVFDLNDHDGAHGPHGLLGGMTGSGKSEVLKAIILALAVTHHPYDINFALIDFKGGAAFNELAHLPHTVGVVTDIESNATFAERVILALSGEIERRKRVLEDARAAFGFGRSHIDEYREQPVRRPLPRLVIVFDEFAEFKQRNPVESKKLISIARQGRSLGVHLILATQNIEAAVDPEILQNSSFRICLKVAEAQDSMQMVGIPDAINLTRGRAYFASNSRLLYQSAFSGAAYSSQNGQGQARGIVCVYPDGHREKMDFPRRRTSSGNEDMASTQAGAVVRYIAQKAQEMNLKKPPSVWPDALSERYFLPDILSKTLSGGWDGQIWQPCQIWGKKADLNQLILPILGLCDLPEKQEQIPLQMSSSQGGHLLIFGSAGSGKSTLLRTLVTSLALTQTPAAAQVYILDYGGQSALKSLETFPHVGAVVTRLETERAERLVSLIQSEINRRNNLLRETRVDNWQDFNAIAPEDQKLPALFLLIDGFRDFKQSFENEFINSVTALISGGQAAGLYLIAAASLQNDIPNDLFANINMRLSFNQADPTEYFRIIGTPSEAKLEEDAAKGVRPGRGLLRATPPVEFQTALPVYGNNDKDQAYNLILLAEQMDKAWKGKLPTPVLTLPQLVTLPEKQDTQPSSAYFSMLGLDFETLSPTGFLLLEDGPAFLIGSVSNQCGKTTLLRTWLLGLADLYPPERLQAILIDYHTRTMAGLRRLPIVQSYVGSQTALDDVLVKLSTEIDRRQKELEKIYEKDPENFDEKTAQQKWPLTLVVIDDYETFYLKNGAELTQLTDCFLRGAEVGIRFILSGNISDLPNSYSDNFIGRVQKLGCGILLGGFEGIDIYNNTRRPAGGIPAGLPPGRGYLIKRGRAGLVQTAAYWQKDQPAEEALQQRVRLLLQKGRDE